MVNRPLSARALARLKPPREGRIQLFDPGCRGLSFRFIA